MARKLIEHVAKPHSGSADSDFEPQPFVSASKYLGYSSASPGEVSRKRALAASRIASDSGRTSKSESSARKRVFQQALVIFAIAFIFNLLWEFWHVRFYISYQGAEATNWILIRSALFVDAVVITVFSWGAMFISGGKYRFWLVPILCAVFAIGLERYALVIERWIYASSMPIIPWLDVGLTPAIQLPLAG